MSKTAEQHRAAAEAHEVEAAASFERCDTDGALSQWASGINAQLERRLAEIAEAGGVSDFPALFDLDGNLVPAKLINGRYGWVWALLASDDPDSEIVGWVKAFPERKSTMERKGYREGRVMAPATAIHWAPKSARGLSGALLVQVVTRRTDGGFSRAVEVVSDGR